MELEAQVVDEEKTLQELIGQRNILVQEAGGQKKGKKKKLMKEAEVLNVEIEIQQQKLDSVTLAMVQLKEKENNINSNSSRLLKQASVDDSYKMIMLAELRIKGNEESTYVAEETVVDSEEVAVLEEEVVDVLKGITLIGDLSKKSTDTEFVATGTTLENSEFKTLGTEIPQDLEGDLFITAASATVSSTTVSSATGVSSAGEHPNMARANANVSISNSFFIVISLNLRKIIDTIKTAIRPGY